MKTFVSDLSGKVYPIREMASGHTLIQPVLELVRQDHPEFNENGTLSISELNYYREKFMENYLTQESGQLTELQKNVLGALKERSTISEDLEGDGEKQSLGQRLSDKIAKFGGSWKFILFFLAFIFLWMAVNVVWLVNKGFDPYPFILLNLILSCLAAFQAPVIMMSQNRQEEKDRQRSRNDYMVNLKSELEVRMLQEKIDHLVLHQQKELMEIQKIQIDMLNEISEKLGMGK
jgi:uncharacterized membrane protein